MSACHFAWQNRFLAKRCILLNDSTGNLVRSILPPPAIHDRRAAISTTGKSSAVNRKSRFHPDRSHTLLPRRRRFCFKKIFNRPARAKLGADRSRKPPQSRIFGFGGKQATTTICENAFAGARWRSQFKSLALGYAGPGRAPRHSAQVPALRCRSLQAVGDGLPIRGVRRFLHDDEQGAGLIAAV